MNAAQRGGRGGEKKKAGVKHHELYQISADLLPHFSSLV